ERPQRGVDAPKILDDRRAGAHLTHMRDSVSRHDVLLSTCDGSPLFRAAAPVDVGRQRTVGLRARPHHNLLSSPWLPPHSPLLTCGVRGHENSCATHRMLARQVMSDDYVAWLPSAVATAPTLGQHQ